MPRTKRPAVSVLVRLLPRKPWIAAIAAGVIVLGAAVAIRSYWPTESAQAQRPRPAASSAPAVADQRPRDVVALVNGEKISRQELAAECLRHYQHDVLEAMLNRDLILGHCTQQGIQVTAKEIDEEIERMAGRFGIPVDRWMQMLQQERGIHPDAYRRDIIWPTLALRKLAEHRLKVTDEELQTAYEMEYGPQVKCRMIGIYDDREKAGQVREQAAANPKDFARLARIHSDDTHSASGNGWVPPIRRHAGAKEIEQVAFSLAEGEVSPVIELNDQFIILLCEGHLRAQNVPFDEVAPQLEELIRDRKLRTEATDLFQQLKDEANVQIIIDDPQRRSEMPGVAALVNGRQITMRQLAEECIDRHGTETLSGLINRRLIEQALRHQQITVSQEAIDAEIADAARRMTPPKRDGSPDVDAWLDRVTSEPGVTVELYVRDVVWPSVALKEMVADSVKVTDQDLEMAREATYGPKVRALAIVLDDERQAKRVWEMARDNLSEEYFGRLAEQYSTDASTKALRGEIPPIQRSSGRPHLEQEAFNLRPGELSGVIHVDGKFVILYCIEQTQSQDVSLQDTVVRNQLYNHIHRQKESQAMAQLFEHLQQSATIVNYLAPEMSQDPGKGK